MRLCVLHNLYFYNTMMEEIRHALDQGRFEEYKETETGRYGCRSEGLNDTRCLRLSDQTKKRKRLEEMGKIVYDSHSVYMVKRQSLVF